MQIKKQPEKPKRKTIEQRKHIGEFDTLQSILLFFKDKNISFEEIYIEYVWDSIGFIWEESESDVNFNKRMANYEKRLKEWQDWYDENEKAILTYKEQKRAKERIKLEKQIAKLNEQLGEL